MPLYKYTYQHCTWLYKYSVQTCTGYTKWLHLITQMLLCKLRLVTQCTTSYLKTHHSYTNTNIQSLIGYTMFNQLSPNFLATRLPDIVQEHSISKLPVIILPYLGKSHRVCCIETVSSMWFHSARGLKGGPWYTYSENRAKGKRLSVS